MSDFAIWRRLDTPGHDAALLTPSASGWLLRGMTVFKDKAGPACIRYSVELDASWRTVRGTVQGFRADEAFDHVISRAAGAWHLDGAPIDGLRHLVDLDYGFTPATNLQQLRRVALERGQAADLPVVWFDVGADTLVELPQRYERRGDSAYWYEAPTARYEGLLQLSANGFARIYPQLWEMET